MQPDPDASEDHGRSWYPGPSDPGRRTFLLAMSLTALATISLIILVIATWPPPCWGTHCS
jgi:hypothetical protein